MRATQPLVQDRESMYLKRIVCKNLRGFEHIDLDLCPMAVGSRAKSKSVSRVQNEQLLQFEELLRKFEDGPPKVELTPDSSLEGDAHYPGWSVITGDNGSGKTTLLKAIALALLGPAKARYLQDNFDGWVTHDADHAETSLEIRPDSLRDKVKGGGHPYRNTFWAEVDIVRAIDSVSPGEHWALHASDHFRKQKKGAANGPWESVPGWLAVGYGPFRRLYGSSPEAAGLEADPLKARFATLFKEDATLIGAERWLQDLDYQRKDDRQDASEALTAITSLLQADFLRNGMRFERVDSRGVWLSDDRKRLLRLADMSEGYRAAIAMLIDIVRQMFFAYGFDTNIIRLDGEFAYVDAPAVVLIDEVDAHLHPAWQREIGFWLKRHFPRVQFIVTTHSPLVCQAADGGRIYILPATDDHSDEPRRLSPEEFARIVAGRPDEVLQTRAFGLPETRSGRISRMRRRHAELRQLSLFDDNQRVEMEQLEMMIDGQLPKAE
jgi:hypothetical protein